jgi:hypothetical protein
MANIVMLKLAICESAAKWPYLKVRFHKGAQGQDSEIPRAAQERDSRVSLESLDLHKPAGSQGVGGQAAQHAEAAAGRASGPPLACLGWYGRRADLLLMQSRSMRRPWLMWMSTMLTSLTTISACTSPL